MPGSRLPMWGTLAGVVTGLAVTAGLVVAGPLRLPTGMDRSDPTDDFLAAWERSRRGTYVVRSRFERRQPGGAVLEAETELVQRPPDRLLRRFGEVTGTVGGRQVVCTDDAGTLRCAASEPVDGSATFDEEIRRELDTFRDWFRRPAPGARPRYRLLRGSGEGCYDLVLAVPGAEAPYGTDARVCFDAATGAVRSLDRRFDNGVIESEWADSITGVVMPADLELPR